MSLRSLERVILMGARVKDLLEWSTASVSHRDGEVVAFIPDPGVYVAIAMEHNRNPKIA